MKVVSLSQQVKSREHPWNPHNPQGRGENRAKDTPMVSGKLALVNLCVVMLLLSVSTVQASPQYHPHQPYIWTLRNQNRQQGDCKENCGRCSQLCSRTQRYISPPSSRTGTELQNLLVSELQLREKLLYLPRVLVLWVLGL